MSEQLTALTNQVKALADTVTLKLDEYGKRVDSLKEVIAKVDNCVQGDTRYGQPGIIKTQSFHKRELDRIDKKVNKFALYGVVAIIGVAGGAGGKELIASILKLFAQN